MIKQNTLFLKRLLAIVCCLGLLLSGSNFSFLSPTARLTSQNVMAADDDEEITTIAYLDYTAGSWTNYGNPDDETNGVYHKPATIKGAGTYTASLDFSSLDVDSRPQNTNYIALQIKNGPELFPNYAIKLWSLKVNGVDLPLEGKGYTNDEGGNTRMNLYNEWVSPPYSGRSYDEDMEGVTSRVIPKEFPDSPKVQTLDVEFSYMPVGNPITAAYLGGDAIGSALESWGAVPSDESHKNTYIVGKGYYTVGVVSTSDIAAPNYALVIAGAADVYPGNVIRIIDVRVAGEDGVLESIPFQRGNTRDEGIHDSKNSTRTNIYNQYAAEVDANNRTWGEIELMTPWVLESNTIEGKRQIFIDFEFIPVDNGVPVDVYLEYADTEWEAAYLHEQAEESTGVPTKATMTNVGKYKVSIDFSETTNKEARGVDLLNIRVVDGETNYPGWKIKVETIIINDGSKDIIINPYDEKTNDIGFKPGFTYSNDAKDMLYDFNNDGLQKVLKEEGTTPTGTRIYDGLLIKDGYFETLASTTQFVKVKTIEVTFRFQLGEPVVLPEIDWTEHLRDSNHNFYMGVQESTTYIFRDEWTKKDWGKHKLPTEEDPKFSFDHLYRTDDHLSYGGTFADVLDKPLVHKDSEQKFGTYTVTLDIAEGEGFEGAPNTLNMLYVSTDIYFYAYYLGFVKIFDVVLEIDGIPVDTDNNFAITAAKDDRPEKTNPDNVTSSDYLNINLINTYQPKLKTFPYDMPTESVSITFSLSYMLPPNPREIAPDVTFDNDMATVGTVGTAVPIKFSATSDNEFAGEEFEYAVTVKRGETDVTVTLTDGNYSFNPDESGDYVITIIATDDLDNASEPVVHTVFVSANKAALSARYNELKDIEKGKYSTKSYNQFKEKLEAAEDIIGNPNAKQADVDNALSALNTAYTGLKKGTGCSNSKASVFVFAAIACLAFVFVKKRSF